MIVTVFGLGALAGAVYVAVADIAPLPEDGIVIGVSIPQAAPEHPAPASDHVIAVLGFDPGTGWSIAVTLAELPAVRLGGAETVSVKRLVIVIAALACFEASATLCATTVTLASEGRTCGAVYFPAASIEPQFAAHAAPLRLQRTDGSGCPLLLMAA